jgi:hypothetical protein
MVNDDDYDLVSDSLLYQFVYLYKILIFFKYISISNKWSFLRYFWSLFSSWINSHTHICLVWVCLRMVVSNVYCVVFLFCFFFDLYALCCWFLWIILFLLTLRYSLMFIIHHGWAIIFSRKLKGDNIIICHHNIDLSPFRLIPPCLPKKHLCQMYILRISLQ